jgi:3-oxoacyl-[acyl-carrier-protein] synthase III
MFILGVGAAYPEQVLSNQDLAALGLTPRSDEHQFLERCGVQARRVSLPTSYISETKNKDVVAARSHATVSPSALAVAAIQQALVRAGISIEQIGLLLADTATPDQTCPSEAQRIGGLLGIKVPAYDVVSGSGTIPYYLEMLSSWKPERVPEYVLCVSTNTPSQHTSFSDNALSAYLLGDAATAVVISLRQTGKLRVESSFVRKRKVQKPAIVVEGHADIDISLLPDGLELEAEITQSLKQLLAVRNDDQAGLFFVGPQLFASQSAAVAAKAGFSQDRIVSVVDNCGYSLGSSIGCALSSIWDGVHSAQGIVVIHGGDGAWSGSLLLVSQDEGRASCCIS